MQALVDPATGEQVTLSPNANAAGNVSGAAAVQVITVADPVTGEPVQQMVQNVVDRWSHRYQRILVHYTFGF